MRRTAVSLAAAALVVTGSQLQGSVAQAVAGTPTVSGYVVAEDGVTPVGGASVTAWWIPLNRPDSGVAQPVLMGSSTSSGSGYYTLNATLTPAMQAEADDNGGWVNFFVSSYSTTLDRATTVTASREVVDGAFVAPDPLKATETVSNPSLSRATKPRLAAKLAAGREAPAATDDEDPSVSSSVAPVLTLVLEDESVSASSPAASRTGSRAGVQAEAAAQTFCQITYQDDTKGAFSVVEFHNAANGNGQWTYGETADSDIGVGIKVGGTVGGTSIPWKLDGTGHVSNTRSLTVGNGASGGDKANEWGRTNMTITHMTIKALPQYPASDGTKCYEYPDEWRVGTKIARASKWVGGAFSNTSIAGAEYIGCGQSPQKDHRTWYDAPNGTMERRSVSAARIGMGGDLGPIWATAKSGFSKYMKLNYAAKRGNGIWLCGTNYYPDRAGVIHAQNHG